MDRSRALQRSGNAWVAVQSVREALQVLEQVPEGFGPATPFYEKATPSQTSLLIENLIGKGCSEVPEELLGLVEPFPLNLGLLQILINPFKQPLAAQ